MEADPTTTSPTSGPAGSNGEGPSGDDGRPPRSPDDSPPGGRDTGAFAAEREMRVQARRALADARASLQYAREEVERRNADLAEAERRAAAARDESERELRARLEVEQALERAKTESQRLAAEVKRLDRELERVREEQQRGASDSQRLRDELDDARRGLAAETEAREALEASLEAARATAEGTAAALRLDLERRTADLVEAERRAAAAREDVERELRGRVEVEQALERTRGELDREAEARKASDDALARARTQLDGEEQRTRAAEATATAGARAELERVTAELQHVRAALETEAEARSELQAARADAEGATQAARAELERRTAELVDAERRAATARDDVERELRARLELEGAIERLRAEHEREGNARAAEQALDARYGGEPAGEDASPPATAGPAATGPSIAGEEALFEARALLREEPVGELFEEPAEDEPAEEESAEDEPETPPDHVDQQQVVDDPAPEKANAHADSMPREPHPSSRSAAEARSGEVQDGSQPELAGGEPDGDDLEAPPAPEEEFEQALLRLAGLDLGRRVRRRVRQELEGLTNQLEGGEEVIGLALVDRGEAAALLACTDRRLLVVPRSDTPEAIDYEAIKQVRLVPSSGRGAYLELKTMDSPLLVRAADPALGRLYAHLRDALGRSRVRA